MNENELNMEVINQIQKDLIIGVDEAASRDHFIALIAQRVAYLLENDKDLLMSYLYRLDISMKKINQVLKLKQIVPPNESIAMLIFERQMERVKTKKNTKINPIEEGWDY